MASFTMYGCKPCGAELFLTKEDIAEHTTECEKTPQHLRDLARQWLAAGAPRATMPPKRRTGQRHAEPQGGEG